MSSSQAIVQSLDSLTNGSVDSGSRVDVLAAQPQFDRKLANCKLVAGTDVVLSCHVTGNPMPNVSDVVYAITSFNNWHKLYNPKLIDKKSTMKMFSMC